MTREIEFRGKFASFNQFVPHPDEGNWVYGDFVHDGMLYLGEYHDCIYTDDENGRSMIRVDKDTVGEFTGLRDKNGVKVFEGDVVHIVWYDTMFSKWREKTMLVEFKWGRFTVFQLKPFKHSDKRYFEVIGNIFDNPELLNKK